MLKKNWLIILILVAALFLRVYRIPQVLGFYFDQGRDALVIWDLIHLHKFFLIGPTTGLAGIFRGPYYYYLITPFYFLGGGNPVVPADFLALTSVIAIYLMYLLASKIQDKTSGIIAAVIAGFSFYIVLAGRWLSNPTPMLILSMILVYSMFRIAKTNKRKDAQIWWAIISAVAGLSLFNFGSSGEFFYFPALFIFVIWQRKKFPTLKYLLISGFVFFLTFAPLVLFDLKHDHILLHNLFSTFGGDGGSFKLPTQSFMAERTRSYYDIFTNKLFDAREKPEIIVMVIAAIFFLINLPKLIKNDGYKIIILLLISPIIGLYFYQGNYGVLYDYYLTGYYLIFILFYGLIFGKIWKANIVGKLFIVYFLYLFFSGNLPIIWSKINDNCTGNGTICFANEKTAINWIYDNSAGQKFNVDIYVPPQIPYAYNYILTWRSNPNNVTENVPLLYTLYEVDDQHPSILNDWLKRQNGIGKIEAVYSTGGITVQRRIRND